MRVDVNTTTNINNNDMHISIYFIYYLFIYSVINPAVTTKTHIFAN